MLKKKSIIIIAILLLVGLNKNVFAKDTYTTTSVINGVTANWEYELNESNQIENLKCINPTDLTGNITIPSTLDGKTVISLKNESFKGAENITGLVIPSTLKIIGYNSFENCSNLTNVNLGQIENISFDVFKNCPKLTNITLPKTLKYGPGETNKGVFTGTTNLTSVVFENETTTIASGILKDCKGITKVTIPNTVTKIGSRAFSNSGITEIDLPNSVKEIAYKAFENCSNLTSVNLGQIENISFDVFKDCPKLTTITLPKTLKYGSGESNIGVFTGTTNLISATFENGTTTIASGILKDCKGITKVTIPNTVTKIGSRAFSNSGITEIDLPNSVTEINYNAFEKCDNLTKITILDNCTTIAWFKTQPNIDSVFIDHNENLTIYCYKNSKIAEYAIANNIKYVYITKPSSDKLEDDTKKNEEIKQPNTENSNTENKDTSAGTSNNENIQKDNTIAKNPIPQTGEKINILILDVIILIIAIFIYFKFYKFKDIK